MIKNQHKDKINKLISVFKEAEKQLKHSEHDTNELSIPSINQLRYVAFHLIESFDLQDGIKVEEELNKRFIIGVGLTLFGIVVAVVLAYVA